MTTCWPSVSPEVISVPLSPSRPVSTTTVESTPLVRTVTVDCDVLTDGDSELKIVIMTAAPESTDENKLRLAAVAGPPAAPALGEASNAESWN